MANLMKSLYRDVAFRGLAREVELEVGFHGGLFPYSSKNLADEFCVIEPRLMTYVLATGSRRQFHDGKPKGFNGLDDSLKFF